MQGWVVKTSITIPVCGSLNLAAGRSVPGLLLITMLISNPFAHGDLREMGNTEYITQAYGLAEIQRRAIDWKDFACFQIVDIGRGIFVSEYLEQLDQMSSAFTCSAK